MEENRMYEHIAKHTTVIQEIYCGIHSALIRTEKVEKIALHTRSEKLNNNQYILSLEWYPLHYLHEYIPC